MLKISMPVTKEYDQGPVIQIYTVLWHFTMSLLQGSSETSLFIDLSNHVSWVRNFGNTKAVKVIFCSKCSKLILDFKNAAKIFKKLFSFSDNYIWIGIVKLSLLRTGYFSSAANVLIRRPKIWHVKIKYFFEHNFVASDQ